MLVNGPNFKNGFQIMMNTVRDREEQILNHAEKMYKAVFGRQYTLKDQFYLPHTLKGKFIKLAKDILEGNFN